MEPSHLKSTRWNAPNIITMSRIAVTPLYLIFIFRPELWAKWTAGLLFAWGAISDYLDGYLARKYNLKTSFGALMDPLADKVLILSVFLSFIQLELVPTWMVIIIAAREFLITGLRQIAESRGVIIAASRGGKHKTISQILAISVILAILCARATAAAYQMNWGGFINGLGEWGPWLNGFMDYGPYWLMFYATVMSVWSGVDYLIRNRNVLQGEHHAKR
ncbi:MAG TPA: CDP-diacylglycerol--glycerol-3-phosphate 3-phosphatidyltransferase [bacterium]|jgi:CDP-diacylglycerol--glycerol-3-phosphate 3-phosphatidyltransferase|nr:CDP-diacylglycerol--glycerol-3-phosphate 3-phosphatidyltransferase [bacterium]